MGVPREEVPLESRRRLPAAGAAVRRTDWRMLEIDGELLLR